MKEREGGEYRIVCKLTDEQETKNFCMNNIIVQAEPGIRERNQSILLQDYFVPAYFQCSSKEQILLQNKKFINDETIQKVWKTIKKFPEAKKITFNEN